MGKNIPGNKNTKESEDNGTKRDHLGVILGAGLSGLAIGCDANEEQVTTPVEDENTISDQVDKLIEESSRKTFNEGLRARSEALMQYRMTGEIGDNWNTLPSSVISDEVRKAHKEAEEKHLKPKERVLRRSYKKKIKNGKGEDLLDQISRSGNQKRIEHFIVAAQGNSELQAAALELLDVNGTYIQPRHLTGRVALEKYYRKLDKKGAHIMLQLPLTAFEQRVFSEVMKQRREEEEGDKEPS